MKILGMIFIALGLALFIFVLYKYFQNRNEVISPVPETEGVKVIYITPSR